MRYENMINTGFVTFITWTIPYLQQ